MNAANPYLKQYQQTQVETATPEKILILLYDGAIQFLNKAKIALEMNETEKIHNNLVGCQNIILEFMGTLNMEEGGKLAENLYMLYEYLYKTLVTANMNKDVTKIDEVLNHLKGLRETWLKAIEISNAERKEQQDVSSDAEDKYESKTYSDEDDDDDDDDE